MGPLRRELEGLDVPPVADAFGNWAKPYVAVAPDGMSVAFSSNRGGDTVDTFVISLPGELNR